MLFFIDDYAAVPMVDMPIIKSSSMLTLFDSSRFFLQGEVFRNVCCETVHIARIASNKGKEIISKQHETVAYLVTNPFIKHFQNGYDSLV